MTDTTLLLDDPSETSVFLHESAAKDYLEYAVAVVKGRALPDVRDGQKPVQRRVLFAMHELKLAASAKPVKSARVVGDVIGKYHPHGDSSAYEAMVRIAQDFSLRYPLVDGQGNFGSRDGDNAAAMRYTEARLAPISELLLAELSEGTVDVAPNYDGSFDEPVFLPARLPFLLLNGASGIAVGMATEIPSHNLQEVVNAAIALMKNPHTAEEETLSHIAGPDFPGGAQIISSEEDIQNAYRTGRGSLRVRARYVFEERARGAWQLVITELPYGVSSAKVLSEIGQITNPQVKTGKKTLDQAQVQLKNLFAAHVERVRDESGKDEAVRLVFEPTSSRHSKDEFLSLLLAHTSLETSVSMNLVLVGLDGRPCQKNLHTILSEWCEFRLATVRRRTAHRLQKAEDRIHILEGRHIVFVHMDEVIALIRESDDPKTQLQQRFGLSEIQANDILEIRLRQLARLEGIRIEKELGECQATRADLRLLLQEDKRLRALVVREITEDAKKYSDPRRTLIKNEAIVTRGEVSSVANEPVTVIISEKGWARLRMGHRLDLSAITYKEGDGPSQIFECRSVDTLIILSSEGRSFAISVSEFPDGKTKGQNQGAPIASFIELGSTRIAQVLIAKADDESETWLIAKTSGYGFIAKSADMMTRQKAGKAFVSMEDAAELLTPVLVKEANHLAALSSDGRLLVFPLADMKQLSGGKGVQIIHLKDKETLIDAKPVLGSTVELVGVFRQRAKVLLSEEKHVGKRARRGASAGLIQSPQIRAIPKTVATELVTENEFVLRP